MFDVSDFLSDILKFDKYTDPNGNIELIPIVKEHYRPNTRLIISNDCVIGHYDCNTRIPNKVRLPRSVSPMDVGYGEIANCRLVKISLFDTMFLIKIRKFLLCS